MVWGFVVEGRQKETGAERRRGKRKRLCLRVLARGKGENKKVKCACQQLFRVPMSDEGKLSSRGFISG